MLLKKNWFVLMNNPNAPTQPNPPTDHQESLQGSESGYPMKDNHDICNACDKRFCDDCEHGPWVEKKMVRDIIAWVWIVFVAVFCCLMMVNGIARWIVYG